MINHNSTLKGEAVKLRKSGKSYREISDQLKVARSTLNGWLKTVPLTPTQKQKLHYQWLEGLKKGRLSASQAHRNTKQEKIQASHLIAREFLGKMSLNKSELELFLAGLYLGEGFKIDNRFGLGNANPEIVLLFIILIRQLYEIKEEKLKVAIFGRADQDPDVLVEYWSNLLHVPKNQFYKTQLDKRTANKTSYKNYFGVCAVEYHDTSIQRRILAISQEMIKYVNKPTKGL